MASNIHLRPEEIVEVNELLKALEDKCQILGVPFFATVVTSNDDTGTTYLRSVFAAQSHLINLTRDDVRKHMLIANGAEAVLPRNYVVLNNEDDFFQLGDSDG